MKAFRSAWNIGGRGQLANSASVDSILAAAQQLEIYGQRLGEVCEEIYRGLCIDMFHSVVMNTPQWTGNAASNWNLGVGHRDTTYDVTLKASNQSERASQSKTRNASRTRFGSPVAEKGDTRAADIAVSRNAGREQAITLTSTVFITNYSKSLSGETYIKKLEDNANDFLRPVNRPGHMVEITEAKVQLLMGRLSEPEIITLRNLKLGNYYGGVLA